MCFPFRGFAWSRHIPLWPSDYYHYVDLKNEKKRYSAAAPYIFKPKMRYLSFTATLWIRWKFNEKKRSDTSFCCEQRTMRMEWFPLSGNKIKTICFQIRCTLFSISLHARVKFKKKRKKNQAVVHWPNMIVRGSSMILLSRSIFQFSIMQQ